MGSKQHVLSESASVLAEDLLPSCVAQRRPAPRSNVDLHLPQRVREQELR